MFADDVAGLDGGCRGMQAIDTATSHDSDRCGRELTKATNPTSTVLGSASCYERRIRVGVEFVCTLDATGIGVGCISLLGCLRTLLSPQRPAVLFRSSWPV